MHLPPPLIMLIAALILVAQYILLPQFNVQFAFQWLAAPIFIGLGLALGFQALSGFIKQKTTIHPNELDKTSALVTTGIYRFTRNPMYLGLAFILGGIGISLGALGLTLILPGFVWVINKVQIGPEEKMLEEKFGQTYTDYKSKVRRWI